MASDHDVLTRLEAWSREHPAPTGLVLAPVGDPGDGPFRAGALALAVRRADPALVPRWKLMLSGTSLFGIVPAFVHHPLVIGAAVAGSLVIFGRGRIARPGQSEALELDRTHLRTGSGHGAIAVGFDELVDLDQVRGTPAALRAYVRGQPRRPRVIWKGAPAEVDWIEALIRAARAAATAQAS